MVATGPAVLATSLAVSAPALQPSMSPAALNTTDPGSAAAAGDPTGDGPGPARANEVVRTEANTTTRRQDERDTNTPPFAARPIGHFGLRHRVRHFLFANDRGISLKRRDFGGRAGS